MFIQKGFLFIEECEDHNGIKFEKYSLQPLWAKLYDYMQHSQNETQERTSEREQKSLYTIFEEEFGRPLSPLECETLAIWQDQDQHDAILIKHALKEAVLSGKLSFRYIDRILFEWKRTASKRLSRRRRTAKNSVVFKRNKMIRKKSIRGRCLFTIGWNNNMRRGETC
jgi:DNA replication protein